MLAMRPRFPLLTGLALAIVLPFCAQAAPPDSPAAGMKIEKIYQSYCASCHGEKLDGGLGGSLIDGEWKHGASDEQIQNSIAVGKPELGMESFDDLLTDEQIRAMVVFFREKEKEQRYLKTEFPQPDPEKITQTRHHAYRTEVIVSEGLKHPWSLAFLPDGRMLVTEKSGPVRLIQADGKLEPQPIAGTPPVVNHGQGGMLEVGVHPDYANNGWIYLGFSDGERKLTEVSTLTAVVRGKIEHGKWTGQEWIYQADRKFYTGAGVHFGTRFVFDGGYLYFVIGERGGMMEVQDLKRPNGKIFRLHDDGRVPEDNPFVAEPGAEPGIWSYGHRNPQGMAMDPRDKALYATEHGPRGGDEFNRIRKGANYGWPVITHGINYNGTPITGITEKEGMEQPVIHWTPSIAACGLACYDGDKFPRWQHDFFAGGLRAEEVRRLRVQDGKVVEQEVVVKNFGRIRDVRSGPDGYLYLVMNSPDRIVRLVPAD